MSVRFRPGIMQSMKAHTDTWTVLERGIMLVIQQNYKDWQDFQVISHLKKYKPSMDASVFAEKTGQLPEIAEVYWRGEFLTEISVKDRPEAAATKINDALIELITRTKGAIV